MRSRGLGGKQEKPRLTLKTWSSLRSTLLTAAQIPFCSDTSSIFTFAAFTAKYRLEFCEGATGGATAAPAAGGAPQGTSPGPRGSGEGVWRAGL